MTDARRKQARQTQALAMFGSGTRGDILRGTALAASRLGVQNITVQAILDAAQVSRRTYYKFFRDTQDALDSLFEVSTQMLAGTIQMAVAGKDEPIAKIEAAVDAYLELQQVGGRLIMELQAESIRPDSQLAPRRDKLLAMFSELIGSNVAQALGRPVDPLVSLAALLCMEGLILRVQRDGPLTNAMRARVRAVYLSMLMRSLGVPGAENFDLPAPPS